MHKSLLIFLTVILIPLAYSQSVKMTVHGDIYQRFITYIFIVHENDTISETKTNMELSTYSLSFPMDTNEIYTIHFMSGGRGYFTQYIIPNIRDSVFFKSLLFKSDSTYYLTVNPTLWWQGIERFGPPIIYDIHHVKMPMSYHPHELIDLINENPTVKVEFVQRIHPKENLLTARRRLNNFKKYLEKYEVDMSHIVFSKTVEEKDLRETNPFPCFEWKSITY